jgi:hypothetical protein
MEFILSWFLIITMWREQKLWVAVTYWHAEPGSEYVKPYANKDWSSNVRTGGLVMDWTTEMFYVTELLRAVTAQSV